MSTQTVPELDANWVSESLHRVAADVSMLIDKAFAVHQVAVEREDKRPVASGGVHISFKIAVQRGQVITHGAILVPFPEAVSLACWLQMLPDEEVRRRASGTTLDQTMKDGLLEIGNFIAGALATALRTVGVADARVVSEGCQGVRPGVRPALKYVEGAPLTVGRGSTQLANGTPFDMIAILPPLDAPVPNAAA